MYPSTRRDYSGWLMARTVVLMSLLTLVLAGCATQLSAERRQVLDTHKTALTASVPCCTSFRDLTYQSLNADEEKKFEVENNTPTFAFETGKSHFQAFKLPQHRDIIHMVVQTYFVRSGSQLNEYAFLDEYAFRPSVMFLDSNYAPLITLDSPALSHPTAGFGLSRLIADIHSPPKAANAEFVIIFSEPDVTEKNVWTNEITPNTEGGYVGAWVTEQVNGGKRDIEIPFSYVGKLSIEVESTP